MLAELLNSLFILFLCLFSTWTFILPIAGRKIERGHLEYMYLKKVQYWGGAAATVVRTT